MSPFLQRKMILAFYRFNVSKDGLLRAADFEQLAQQIAAELGLAADSPQYAQLLRGYTTIWDTYFKGCDSDGDGVITLADYLSAAEGMLARPQIRQEAQAANTPLFAALDLDRDGQITAAEFTVF